MPEKILKLNDLELRILKAQHTTWLAKMAYRIAPFVMWALPVLLAILTVEVIMEGDYYPGVAFGMLTILLTYYLFISKGNLIDSCRVHKTLSKKLESLR